jgi:HD-GYP domain-containing protein (c-di-GMP phosphodiesterase class II)
MKSAVKLYSASTPLPSADTADGQHATLRALLVALRTRDAETYAHSARVVKLSLRFGRECGLDQAQMRLLELGSLLHDLGKIGVPDAVLHKPAKLTAEEWDAMRRHPQHGERILLGIDFLEGASRVVAHHHENWDGSGYPYGLRGEEIDPNARILSVADAFDAMTSDRVYRARRTVAEAARELDRCAGRQFDPAVIEAFHRISGREWRELRGKRHLFSMVIQ